MGPTLGTAGRRRAARCWWPASGSASCGWRGAVALQTPGARDLRRDIQRSTILQRAQRRAAPERAAAERARALRPAAADRGPRRERAAAELADRARARRCGRPDGAWSGCWAPLAGSGVQGSGWVAGTRDRSDERPRGRGGGRHDGPAAGDGPHLDARGRSGSTRTTTWRSCACAGSAAPPPLRLERGRRPGTSAAVLGFPQNGPYDVEPARLGPDHRRCSPRTPTAAGRCGARITSLRGLVRSGNSGGPVVDGDGRVVATVFAASRGPRPPHGLRRAGLGGEGRARARRARR